MYYKLEKNVQVWDVFYEVLRKNIPLVLGKIDLDELCKAFNELGIPLEKMEATNLLQR